MKQLLPGLILSAFLIIPASAGAQVSIGVQFGHPPPAPRAYRVPPSPGPDYEWVEGYWYLQGRHYAWHDGYWTRPPYQGAYWEAPYYSEGRYFPGYWDGRHGTIAHNHRWDRSHQRDEGREGPRHARR